MQIVYISWVVVTQTQLIFVLYYMYCCKKRFVYFGEGPLNTPLLSDIHHYRIKEVSLRFEAFSSFRSFVNIICSSHVEEDSRELG